MVARHILAGVKEHLQLINVVLDYTNSIFELPAIADDTLLFLSAAEL